MRVVSGNFAKQPFVNAFLAFHEKHRLAFRVAGHLLMWVVVYFLLIHTSVPRMFEDNQKVVSIASFSEMVISMITYYFTGYYIFPKFFYRQNYIKLSLSLLAIFFIIYILNYYLFFSLSSLSTQSQETTYARNIFAMLKEAGLLGCFTNLRVALWNLSYGCFLPILLLILKGFRDIIGYQRKLVSVERDRAALELSFLKAQVNPHFLFNTLNSVYSRIFATDEQAANLVLQLSELMRYNLYETNEKYVALDRELNFLQNYLDLERNRLEGQDVVIDYEESGDATKYKIAPLILVAFVENAFKHGVKSVVQPAYVQVMAVIEEDHLLFQVENSVPPKRESAPSLIKSGGVGLGNVRQRLDALYKERHTLDVTETDETYTVLLTIGLLPRAD